MPANFYRAHRAKAVREPIFELSDGQGNVYAAAEGGSCIFLGEDCRCVIYATRPPICRRYGDESHLFLTCPYQDKDGRVRFRAERKRIWRKQRPAVEKTLRELGDAARKHHTASQTGE
jgi:Fe-S-cluster containining protein